MYFILVISFLVLQRLSELFVARRNERWLLQQGAIEYGQKHYRWIVLMHICFISSLIVEYLLRPDPVFYYPLLICYLVLVAAKTWVIASLGRFWNTKIYRVPGVSAVRRGLYRYIRHPNYAIVVAEILIIPLIFGLYVTAVIFTLLNAIALSVRIKEENRVWAE